MHAEERIRVLHDRAVKELVEAHTTRKDEPLVLAVRYRRDDPGDVYLLEVLDGFPGGDDDDLLIAEFEPSPQLRILGKLHLALGSPGQPRRPSSAASPSSPTSGVAPSSSTALALLALLVRDAEAGSHGPARRAAREDGDETSGEAGHVEARLVARRSLGQTFRVPRSCRPCRA